MPELPEVETVVRGLATCLPGRRVDAVEVLHRPTISGSPLKPACLIGRRFVAVTRRGKFIRVELDGGLGMAVHLRMTGWLGLVRKNVKHPMNDAYVRLRITLDGGDDLLLFRDIRTFGRVWSGELAKIDKLKSIAKLGPEPLTIGADEFAARLHSKSGGLKALLLNQEFLAGIGNIYADEALFGAALHPLTKASRVRPERAQALHASIQKVLQAAIAAGGSSVENYRNADGEKGWFQRELLAYGRQGEACRRCKGTIKRIVVGQRGTWFCPGCQRRR